MLIVCPSCASEYAIDPAKLGPQGRTVRCAICRDSWFAAPEGAEAAPEPEAPPAGATLLTAPQHRPAQNGRLRFLAAAAVLLALGGATQIPSAWLKTGRAAAMGLVRTNRPILTFRQVQSEVEGGGDARTLKVSGEIVNVGDRAADVPHLEFLVHSGDERVLATWTSAPPQPTLSAHAAARFEARLVGPPADGREVRVQFTKAGGTALAFRSPF